MGKINENGERVCDNHKCDLLATVTLVWEKPMCYCVIHAEQALNLADVMGYPVPRNTARQMTIDEMLPDDEGVSDDI